MQSDLDSEEGTMATKNRAREQLAEHEAALAEAREQLRTAEVAFDAEAAVTARSRVETLNGFVSRLKEAAATEAEAEYAAEARIYLEGLPARWADLSRDLESAAKAAREQITGLLGRLNQLYGADHALAREALGAKVLRLRFGVAAPALARPLAPAVPDLLRGVLDFLSRSPHRVPPFDVTVSAAATPAERTAATWTALRRFVSRQGGASLPAEVRALLDRAGIPEPVESEMERLRREQRVASDAEAARQLARFPTPVFRHGI